MSASSSLINIPDPVSITAKEQSTAFKSIRHESTDAYNRLHSIAEDATFISRVAGSYPTFRIYPNLRCGACSQAQVEPVYFKSTDGHFGQWGFNLRRANLHLLSAASETDGFILVDSTRRGKRLPDALSKTIPIWCAVINLAVKKASKKLADSHLDVSPVLHTPPGAVSQSEHSQIEAHLDAWATDLLLSEFSLPSLQTPLRPIWITPSTQTLPSLSNIDFFPVVCVSASRLVPEGIDRRFAGFTYVQGSGDDHESWSQGLTPEIYWHNEALLLSSSRSDLLSLISSLVDRSAKERRTETGAPIPVTRVNARIAIGKIPGTLSELNPGTHAYILVASQPLSVELLSSPKFLLLESPTGKKGQHSLLTDILPRSVSFIGERLRLGEDVVILCEDGKDISVGVAVAALCLCFDDRGVCTVEKDVVRTTTKQTVHKRLQWVLAGNTRANPSRTTLKRVNEFLMSPPRTRRLLQRLGSAEDNSY